MKEGRNDRRARLTEARSGVWGTSSQDFLHLALDLFRLSREDAARFDGNVSPYVLAGIPLLFSAFRCLLIELNAMSEQSGGKQEILNSLANSPNDISVFAESYQTAADLRQNLELLYEVRNEIIHPSHRPAGTPLNTPNYLAALRERGLLQSSGGANSDYIWLDQLQSYRLFHWAFEVIEAAAIAALKDAPSWMAEGYRESYGHYKDIAGSGAHNAT